ncbi:hypothetical protein [Variovorax boronicumulans]|uniref:hypothetical protein n=1 Tax=Variovorax boronicumulans TaxID=436515 RepID=UPI00339AAA56
MFSHEDLLKLQDWQPIAPGFGHEANFFDRIVAPLISELQAPPLSQVLVIANGGLSNYAAVFVHARRGDYGKIEGLQVNMSLLGPFAAIGRKSAHITPTSFARSGLEPEELLASSDLVSEFERSVFSLVEAAGYRVISTEEASERVPEGIRPYEYCLGKEPWDRIFHMLFSDTD